MSNAANTIHTANTTDAGDLGRTGNLWKTGDDWGGLTLSLEGVTLAKRHKVRHGVFQFDYVAPGFDVAQFLPLCWNAN